MQQLRPPTSPGRTSCPSSGHPQGTTLASTQARSPTLILSCPRSATGATRTGTLPATPIDRLPFARHRAPPRPPPGVSGLARGARVGEGRRLGRAEPTHCRAGSRAHVLPCRATRQPVAAWCADTATAAATAAATATRPARASARPRTQLPPGPRPARCGEHARLLQRATTWGRGRRGGRTTRRSSRERRSPCHPTPSRQGSSHKRSKTGSPPPNSGRTQPHKAVTPRRRGSARLAGRRGRRCWRTHPRLARPSWRRQTARLRGCNPAPYTAPNGWAAWFRLVSRARRARRAF